MKISLLLNLGQALTRNANLDKPTKMLYSFIDYCKSHDFHILLFQESENLFHWKSSL